MGSNSRFCKNSVRQALSHSFGGGGGGIDGKRFLFLPLMLFLGLRLLPESGRRESWTSWSEKSRTEKSKSVCLGSERMESKGLVAGEAGTTEGGHAVLAVFADCSVGVMEKQRQRTPKFRP